MKLTVVPSDRFMRIDGRELFFTFDADPSIHAIQWDGQTGHVEYVGPRSNEPITEEYLIPFIAAFNSEKSRVDAIREAELAFYNSPEEVAKRAAIVAAAEAKAEAILTNLPTWARVSTAVDNISNLAEAKVFIKKLSRIVYWLAKDTVD